MPERPIQAALAQTATNKHYLEVMLEHLAGVAEVAWDQDRMTDEGDPEAWLAAVAVNKWMDRIVQDAYAANVDFTDPRSRRYTEAARSGTPDLVDRITVMVQVLTGWSV
jgi:hypothetical protein